MELNKDYKQIFLHGDSDYDLLKNKVVDKVAFTNTGNYDVHMCIITFTDKTFIAIGTGYDNEDDPKLGDKLIVEPKNWNTGNFRLYMHVNSDNKIIYSPYIRILRDFDIWQFTDEEELAIIEKQKRDKEYYEYREYLRLKEKFEKDEDCEYREYLRLKEKFEKDEDCEYKEYEDCEYKEYLRLKEKFESNGN